MSLKEWRKSRLDRYKISQLFYFSLSYNFPSILRHGILPQNEVERRHIGFKSFAMEEVQARRHYKHVHISNGRQCSIHDLVPLYLTPKTPTLYKRKHLQNDIFFCVVQSYILLDRNVEFAFSDGNAASSATRYYYNLDNLSCLDWDVIRSDSWDCFMDGKRKRCAEFLIYPRVPVNRIWDFVVNNSALQQRLEREIDHAGFDIPVRIMSSYFF